MPVMAACAQVILLEVMPAPTPDGRSIPGWFWLVAVPADLAFPVAVLLLAPLAYVGFKHLRRNTVGWRWPGAWAGVVVAALALEALAVTTLVNALVGALHPQGLSYPIAGRMNWGWLVLGIGFLAIAAVMTGLLTRAPVSSRGVGAERRPT